MEKTAWPLQKRQLLNTVHDLKTPLTSVKGYLELINAGSVKCGTPEYWNFIGVVERCVAQMETLTIDLLDSYKLESRAMRLDLTEIQLDSFIDEVQAEMTPILVSRTQKLAIKTTFDRQGIMADKYKLTQVLLNLINNASKFSPCGYSIELIVDGDEGHVRFSVKDQGIGMRPEDIPKLFQPFPDIEVEGKYTRTGLGLSISKGIIDLHNGEINAESDGPGQGSRFWFTIPLNNKSN